MAVEKDGLWVETLRKSTCGSCAVRKGCGHGLLNEIADGRRGFIRVLPGEQSLDDFRVNDQVLIGIPEAVILRGSVIAYLLPLFLMLLGAVVAATGLPGHGDPWALPGAAAGLVLGLLLVRWHGARHRHDPAYQPVLQGAAVSPPEPAQLS